MFLAPLLIVNMGLRVMGTRQSVSRGLASTLSSAGTPRCISSVCTLFASSSMPIQRSLRISRMRSFDARCSAEPSRGFGSLGGVPTDVLPISLLTIERSNCDGSFSRREPKARSPIKRRSRAHVLPLAPREWKGR